MRRIFAPALLLALALAAPAAAEPGFLTLDRQDAQSRFGGEISYFLLQDGIDATALRFELHGQYVMPSTGFGFYGALPITFISPDQGDSITALANIEVGGIFVPRMANPAIQLPIHAGITVPTASNDLDKLIANSIGISARITDYALLIPEGLSLRLGVSPIYRSGQFFARLDGGLDINLSQSGDGTTDPLIHVNVGAGIDLGGVSFSGELVSVITTDSDQSDQMVNALGFGIRGATGALRPYGGIVIPLDNDVAADTVFTAGLEGALQ